MFATRNEPVFGADKVLPLPPAATAPLEINVKPADTIFGAAPPKDVEKAPAQRESSFFGNLARGGARLAGVAFLCALAWGAGAYYSRGHLPAGLLNFAQGSQALQSPARDDLASSVRQMSEELRALKASVDGREATQNPAPAASGPAIGDLAGRIDKLESDFTAQFSKMNEQLASIEQQIATSRTALAARGSSPHKHLHLHDAFDPSRDPTAPGAPHPLGFQ